ncbi:PepSY domain-containing protein [Parasphingorhabdus sp. JC815]|uniref:PepSY domain-containing protein n=1 Tax=Parasphingorhabdus sp. JC815 TaxID=3232140 RepID=UPI0034595B57
MLKKIVLSVVVASAALAVTVYPAHAVQRNNEQKAARAQMMAGKGKSLRSIENMVLPRMPDSQYLGPEYDPSAKVYRLKFIRNGRVIFVDVDGRTGAILRQRR